MLNTVEKHNAGKTVAAGRWIDRMMAVPDNALLIDDVDSSRFETDEFVGEPINADWLQVFARYSNIHAQDDSRIGIFYPSEATSLPGRMQQLCPVSKYANIIWGKSSSSQSYRPVTIKPHGLTAVSGRMLHKHLSLAEMVCAGPIESYFSTARHWDETPIVNVAMLDLFEPDLATRVAFKLAEIPAMSRADDSIFPSEKVVAAVQRLVGYLPARSALPDIEIDDSIGAISLVWRDQSHDNAFSLEVPNADTVLGIGFGPQFSTFRPWKQSVNNERKIMSEIEQHSPIKKLLSGA